MTFNPLDPVQMERARGVVAKIKDRLAASEIESRMTDLRAGERPIEVAYRQAEVDVDVARRAHADAKAMLAEREGELIAVAAAMMVTTFKPKYTPAQRDKEIAARLKKDEAHKELASKLKNLEGQAPADQAAADHLEQTKAALLQEQQAREAAIAAAIDGETVGEEQPRFTTELGRKNGAIALRKEDPEYIALKENLADRARDLEAAERALADRRVDHDILLREDKRLADERAFVGACVLAFADLDAPAMAAARIAPPTPAAAAAQPAA